MPQHVLVTGGASGIGLEISRAFAASGARVTVLGRSLDGPKAAQQESPSLETVKCDVSDLADVEAMIVETVGKLGGLDVLAITTDAQPASAARLIHFIHVVM